MDEMQRTKLKYDTAWWSLLLFLNTQWAVAKTTTFSCENRLQYPNLEWIADDSILITVGWKKATFRGLQQETKLRTEFLNNTKRIQLTFIANNGNQTILIEVNTVDDVSKAWDGAGTLSYRHEQAITDFKKLLNSGISGRIFLIQQIPKRARYPKPGGFCVLK